MADKDGKTYKVTIPILTSKDNFLEWQKQIRRYVSGRGIKYTLEYNVQPPVSLRKERLVNPNNDPEVAAQLRIVSAAALRLQPLLHQEEIDYNYQWKLPTWVCSRITEANLASQILPLTCLIHFVRLTMIASEALLFLDGVT